MTVTHLAAAARWLVHRLVVLAVSAGYDELNGVKIGTVDMSRQS